MDQEGYDEQEEAAVAAQKLEQEIEAEKKMRALLKSIRESNYSSAAAVSLATEYNVPVQTVHTLHNMYWGDGTWKGHNRFWAREMVKVTEAGSMHIYLHRRCEKELGFKPIAYRLIWVDKEKQTMTIKLEKDTSAPKKCNIPMPDNLSTPNLTNNAIEVLKKRYFAKTEEAKSL